jgi:hypothetical protein
MILDVTTQKSNTGYASREQEAAMEALAALVAIVVALIGFDVFAVVLGSDSRERSFDRDREAFWTNS